MKFSFSWLKLHLDTTASAQEIGEALVSLGIEVEDIINPTAKLNDFCVGHVLTAERHPNADRLSLCKVVDGSVDAEGNQRVYQVVCGAPNVRSDMKVAFARPGTIIPNTGQPLKLGVIRGVESQGMLCSSAELLLGADSDGIMDLPPDLSAGQKLTEALQSCDAFSALLDPVFDVSITPNRSDCFSVRGLARDLAALNIGKLTRLPIADVDESETFDIRIHCSDDAKEVVPQFALRVIRGVDNKTPSPVWIQEMLIASGCKPISALVDVTNLMCLDLGRPMHVFDLNKLQTNTVHLSLATGNETLEALNDKDYQVPQGAIIITDKAPHEAGARVLSLAGIMGSRNSGVDESTTDVVLESALFDSKTIALGGQKTAILSDSRTRFERGVDPSNIISALDLATNYILKWCGGTPTKAVILNEEHAKCDHALAPVTLTLERLRSVCGDDTITLNEAKTLLENLQFKVEITGESIHAIAPAFRHDITRDVDLIEEVLRLRGYHHIQNETLPLVLPHAYSTLRDRMATYLTTQGYNEAYTWSFIAQEVAQLFSKDTIALDKPLTAEMAVMRPSVLPGLLHIATQAQARSQHNVNYFEWANQFHYVPNAKEPVQQDLTMTGLRVFSKNKRHWQGGQVAPDVYHIKHDVQTLLSLCGVQAFQIEPTGPSYYHPGRVATLKQGKVVLAYFGELHPSVLKEMKVEGVVLGFEIFVNALPAEKATAKQPKAYVPFVYQPMSRDLAFWVDKEVSAGQLVQLIQKVDKNLITAVDVFDVYEGEKAPVGKKSIAVELTLQPTLQTLTLEEAGALQAKIVECVEKGCKGVLRDN